MTSIEFVDSLWTVYDENQQSGATRRQVEDKLKYVLSNIPANEQLTRNQAARILHAFIRDVIGISDITDEKALQKTTELRDLYDCRTCVSDIMQVYVRGIMDAGYHIVETEVKLFGGGDLLTDDDLEKIMSRLVEHYGDIPIACLEK